MNSIKINLLNLDKGKQEYNYKIDDSFFLQFESEQEFSNSDIDVTVLVKEELEIYKMDITIKGSVDLVCDITNDIFRKNICNNFVFFIKFGSFYDDSDLDTIILEKKNILDIKNYIYETVVFSIPLKKEKTDLDEKYKKEFYNKFIGNKL